MLADAAAFRLEDLVHLRRALLALRKSLFNEREILVKICRKDSPFITEAAIYHFRDIYDHLTKFFEIAEMNRDILTSLMEMYLSLVNNRMAEVGNRMNVGPPADPDHHRLHAVDVARRGRRHVRVEHDDRARELAARVPALPPRDGCSSGWPTTTCSSWSSGATRCRRVPSALRRSCPPVVSPGRTMTVPSSPAGNPARRTAGEPPAARV